MLRFSGKIIFMLKKEFLYIFLLRRTLTNHRSPFRTAKVNSNTCPLTDSFWSIISLKPSERTFLSVVKKLRSFTIDSFCRWVSVLFLFSHPTRFENDLPVTDFGAIFSDGRFGFSYPGSRGWLVVPKVYRTQKESEYEMKNTACHSFRFIRGICKF